MMLQITLGEMKLEVDLEANSASELSSRLQAAIARVGSARVAEQAAHAVLQIAVSLSVADCRLPTAAQVKYALDLARKLNIDVPHEALHSRPAMGAFLSIYSELAKNLPA